MQFLDKSMLLGVKRQTFVMRNTRANQDKRRGYSGNTTKIKGRAKKVLSKSVSADEAVGRNAGGNPTTSTDMPGA